MKLFWHFKLRNIRRYAAYLGHCVYWLFLFCVGLFRTVHMYTWQCL